MFEGKKAVSFVFWFCFFFPKSIILVLLYSSCIKAPESELKIQKPLKQALISEKWLCNTAINLAICTGNCKTSHLQTKKNKKWNCKKMFKECLTCTSKYSILVCQSTSRPVLCCHKHNARTKKQTNILRRATSLECVSTYVLHSLFQHSNNNLYHDPSNNHTRTAYQHSPIWSWVLHCSFQLS